MNDIPVRLMIVVFPHQDGATNVLHALQKNHGDHLRALGNAAIVRRDHIDRLHIREIGDLNGDIKTSDGALTAVTIAILLPPGAFGSALSTALVGKLATDLQATGFPDAKLREFGTAVKPKHSAILAIVTEKQAAMLETDFQTHGGRVFSEPISQELVQLLTANTELAFDQNPLDAPENYAPISDNNPFLTRS